MKTEKDLQTYFMRGLKERGVLVEKMESKSCRGWPDLILISDSGFIRFVEMKSPSGGVLSAHQKRKIAALKERGCVVNVVGCKRDADAILAFY